MTKDPPFFPFSKEQNSKNFVPKQVKPFPLFHYLNSDEKYNIMYVKLLHPSNRKVHQNWINFFFCCEVVFKLLCSNYTPCVNIPKLPKHAIGYKDTYVEDKNTSTKCTKYAKIIDIWAKICFGMPECRGPKSTVLLRYVKLLEHLNYFL